MSATVPSREQVIEAIRDCFDPEIPVNIYDLGLIYDVTVEPSGGVADRLNLTSPGCPAAQELPQQVGGRVAAAPRGTAAQGEGAFDPPWDPARPAYPAQ